MPLKVTKTNKTFEYEIEGSTLIYKKLPFLEKKRILFQHMVNGDIPADKSLDLGYDVMRAMIVDWKGVEDEDGKALKFKPDFIDGIEPADAMKFLEDVIMPDFNNMAESAKILEGERDTEEEVKNSEPM